MVGLVGPTVGSAGEQGESFGKGVPRMSHTSFFLAFARSKVVSVELQGEVPRMKRTSYPSEIAARHGCYFPASCPEGSREIRGWKEANSDPLGYGSERW